MLSNSNEDLFGQQPQQQGSDNEVEVADDIFGTPSGNGTPQNSADIFAAPQGSNGGMADDIFGTPAPAEQNAADIFGGSQNNADDIYAGGPAEPAVPERESALVEWQRQKDQEISVIDEKEAKEIAEMKEKASKELAAYNKKVQEAQENRAKHNLSVDQETIASLNSTPENKWERVVSYIDLNRTDLHEKDVSRMKSLLLQLKH